MQGWERYCFDLQANMDDFQFINSRLDGSTGGAAFNLGKTGTGAKKITNVKLYNNTIYNIQGGIGYANNVANLNFSGNHVYCNNSVTIPFIFDALTGSPASLTGLSISNNQFDSTGTILKTKSGGFSIQNNTVTRAYTRLLEIGGGGVVTGGSFVNNTVSGVFSGTVSGYPDSPIFAAGTGVTNLEVSGFFDGGTTSTNPVFYVPDSRSTGNFLDPRRAQGFVGWTPYVANPYSNIVPYKPLTAFFSSSVSTSAWSTGTYSQIVAPGVLIDGQTYLLKLYYNQPGTTIANQVYIVAGEATYSGASAVTINPVSSANYNGNSAAFLLRYKPGTGTFGIEASPNTSGMSGTLTITIAPLL